MAARIRRCVLRFILELEGALFDVADLHYKVHRETAAEVGWSHLDRSTFRRLLRKHGSTADMLRGAKPVKLKDYHERFARRIEDDSVICEYDGARPDGETLEALRLRGPCFAITTGTNLPPRRDALERAGLSNVFAQTESLSLDPRRRPSELRALSGGDERAIVVGGTDAVVRAAVEAGLFTVGITSAICGSDRFHQAGTSVVYRELGDMVDSLKTGAEDMIRAGLLPPPLD